MCTYYFQANIFQSINMLVILLSILHILTHLLLIIALGGKKAPSIITSILHMNNMRI